MDPLRKYPPPPARAAPTAVAVSATDDEDDGEKAHMQDEGYWAWATAIWLSLLSAPLLLFPRFILFLATPSSQPVQRDALTVLESFLCTHTALLLLALSLALIFAIPSTPLIAPQPVPNRPAVPQTHPLLVPLASFLLLSAFVAFNSSPKRIGPLGMLLALGNGVCGVWGAWVVVFGGGGHFSKTTGGDKRTSGFMFGNKTSAREIKKRWKQEREKESKGEEIELKTR